MAPVRAWHDRTLFKRSRHSRARAIRMPSDVYFLDYLPFSVPVSDMLTVIAVALALAMLCAVHGAGRAVRFDAVEALKR